MKENEFRELTEIIFQTGRKADYKKGQIVIREGDISNRFYFLKEGLLRGWTLNDGREITFRFLFVDHLFCSSESFFYGLPCLYSVEAIEDSVLLSVDKKAIDALQSDNTFLMLFNKYLVNRLASYQQLLISRIQDKPEVRYKRLLEENPEIVSRVSQHYIASYLGITPVSLSRIRNRR